VHCVAESYGAAFDERLPIMDVDCVIDKGTDVATDGYSGFAATTLADDLRAHAVGRVFVCGLATDYCVKATALDARAAGFETLVITDASAAVNVDPGDEARALADGVVLAHVAADLRVPDGPLAGEIKTLASAVFVRDDLGWLIASFHNTREQQPPGPPD